MLQLRQGVADGAFPQSVDPHQQSAGIVLTACPMRGIHQRAGGALQVGKITQQGGYGGIAQGIGMALMEEYLPGRTENLHDYLIPTFGDVPPIESLLIEVPDPEGPFGAKGLGEHVLIPTAPAILNAIRHATGAEITRVPALPHRIMEALR